MPVIGLMCFLAACLGHTALCIFSLNWMYGLALPRWLHRALRAVTVLLIPAAAAAFWLGGKFDPWPAVELHSWWGLILGGYIVSCLALGLSAVPILGLQYTLRRRPAALVSNHTRTVDVARTLGFQPVGRGKWRLLARLPGNEIFRVDFAERMLRLPCLPPAWDGLTILHLSDLHLCGTPDRAFYGHVMDLCRQWEPDLVAITGDIVDSQRHHRWIVPLLGRLRWRVAAFAVLGNHDFWHDPTLVRRRLRRLGIHVLGNGWKRVDVRGEPLVVIGHEGPWFRPEPDLSACPAGAFRLCLSHTPDNIRWAQRQGVGLMLAGHNHGGQVRFPLLGSVFVPSRYSRRYDCGVFAEPPTVLHVSRGLCGQQPLRYNCRPEVTKLVLRTDGRGACRSSSI